jgi:predicted nucleic acid-binding protein
MTYLPDTNACITLLRRRNPSLMARTISRLLPLRFITG